VTSTRIREAGDSALLLEFDAVIDPTVNARAIDVAAAIAGRNLPGVRDVVPTYRSVAVHFDPLKTDVVSLAAVLRETATSLPPMRDGRVVEVPVSYGGENGPDLAEVAAFAGVTTDQVIERHSAIEYRVFMLGFLPGFGYMGTVDPSIAAPRKSTPRTRVPAGSVGIAGRQTGIYPRQSPGGWQLIGHTALRVFDPSRNPPSLFRAGDRVRFMPTQPGTAQPASGIADPKSRPETPHGISSQSDRLVTVIRPGLFTTVQDAGRWGYQDQGVPVAGPMDRVSFAIANAAVGNPLDAAGLEVTLMGPELRFEQTALIAVTGADLGASVDGRPLPVNRAHRCAPGAVLRFDRRRTGTRAYIACDGGIDVPQVLGSRATHAVSGLGGVDGRALKAGDILALGDARGTSATLRNVDAGAGSPGGGARLRIMRGPQDDQFGEAAFDVLLKGRFAISPQSDRMGYRLAGAIIPRIAAAGEMISDAAFIGGVQVPPSGNPILLMADRQTTGGYPQIATVITVDLPLAGQLAPGDWIEFELCSRDEAIAALAAQEERLLATH